MDYDPDRTLLASYLAGECSEKEEEMIQEWIQSRPENKKLMKLMRDVWQTQKIQSHEWDKKKLWSKIVEQAGISTAPRVKVKIMPFIRHSNNLKFLSSPWTWRIAAMLLLTISGTLFYYKIVVTHQGQQLNDLQEILVENGKQVTLTLTDGTKVMLDAGSSFSYPSEFKGNTREVFLGGEGYFEVAYNTEKPFLVHANNALIRVLGTKFNVRAWQLNKCVQVAVAEGKVSLQPDESTNRDEVIITKGLASTLSENGLPSQPLPIDIEKQIGWIHKEVVFDDAPLREILFQLERWYDLKFVLADPSVSEERVTVHIKNNSVEDILELVSALSGLNYTRQGEIVQFGQK